MVIDILLFIVLPIIICVGVTYYLRQKAQFEIAIELFTLITNLYISGEMPREEYIERRTQAYDNLSTLQRYWFRKRKDGKSNEK